jgi:hypothetical protein
MAMIEANELRIGNCVYKKDAFYYEKGHEIKERLHYVTASDIYHIVEDGDPTNHPIILTPEWLETCGWRIVDQGSGPYYWLEKQCWFHIHVSSDGSLYANFNNNAISIQYLHQLQNLYFALTGEELKTPTAPANLLPHQPLSPGDI